MAKVILPVIVGIVLFCISAAASYFLVPRGTPEPTDAEALTEASDNLSAEKPGIIEDSSLDNALPFEPHGITTETVLRLSESLSEQERFLEEWEQALQQKEDRLQLVMDDIKLEQSEVVDLQTTIENQINKAAELMNQFSAKHFSANVATGAANEPGATSNGAASSGVTPEQENENMTTIASWLESMPPELAASSIREFSNDGQMEMAVKLLQRMEQRNAAKILAALQDSALFSEIAQRYRELDTSEDDNQ